jgi:hypothetical protein
VSKEQDPEQVEPDVEAPDTKEINGSKSTYTLNELDQECADEYGWTPQQAEESRLYL